MRSDRDCERSRERNNNSDDREEKPEGKRAHNEKWKGKNRPSRAGNTTKPETDAEEREAKQKK